ncbi:hypothetical protein PS15m_010302 [Mucor circinelloides]
MLTRITSTSICPTLPSLYVSSSQEPRLKQNQSVYWTLQQVSALDQSAKTVDAYFVRPLSTLTLITDDGYMELWVLQSTKLGWASKKKFGHFKIEFGRRNESGTPV